MAVLGGLAVMWASSVGCGLAVERLLGVRLQNALLLPLGFCTALVLTFPGYVLGAGDALAIVLLLAVALAGLMLSRHELGGRLNPGWAGAAGLAAYVLYMLPVIATGHWTWAGYDFVNDSAFEMLLAEHAKGFGTTLGNIPETSAREFLNSYLNAGYPLGTQTLLGTFSGMTATPVAVLYQGFIAFLAAVGATSLAVIARRLLSARRAALAAFVAVAANLTYQYALQGSIKELGLLATLCATAALAREAITLARPYAGAALVAIGRGRDARHLQRRRDPVPRGRRAVLLLGQLILTQRAPRRALLGPLALCAALTALLAIPSLVTLQTFFNVAQSGQGASGVGATQYGQLLRRAAAQPDQRRLARG